MNDLVWVAIILILLLIDKLGDAMHGTFRYSLSAFKYNEDTGHAEPMGIHKRENLLSEAKHTARNILDKEPEASFVSIYEGAKIIDTITRH